MALTEDASTTAPSARFGIPGELVLGALLCLVLLVLIFFHGALQTHDPHIGDLNERFLPVGLGGHILGTDNLGRDLWSRLLEGLTWSMSAASLATLMSAAIGTFLGLVAAQYDGLTRTIVNQVVDTTLSFPTLIIAIIVVASVGRGFWPLTLTLGLVTWPVFARVVYAESLSLVERDYVVAARSFGARGSAILWGHILPGLRPSLTVMAAFHFADMMVAEAALSFLGLGAPLGVPTWGNLLQESRDFLFVAPWLMAVPAGGIVFAVLAANFVGEGFASRARRQGRRIEP
jgi:peptide/nickel transport system permease protein